MRGRRDATPPGDPSPRPPSAGREQAQDRGGVARVFDRVLDLGAALAATLLLAVMLATTVKVIFRYVLHEGLIGIDQISGTLLLYITFLGAAWVLRREEHVTIDLLVTGRSPKTRRRLHVISSVMGALVCLTLTVFGTLEVVGSWQRGILIPAELEIPRAINLAVIPLGSALLCLQFVRRARRTPHHGGPASDLAGN
jgi:TRAP-type C4-dicarboxylate transport system permease small subunit